MCLVDLFFPFILGTCIRTPEINQELMERPLTGESSIPILWRTAVMGKSCVSRPYKGTEQNPLSPEASATPANWEEHLSPCKTSSENPEVPAEKVGTLALKSRKKNRSGASKKQAKNVGSHRLLLGSAGQPPQGSRVGGARPGPCRCPVCLGCRNKKRKDCCNEGPVCLGLGFLKSSGIYMALVSAKDLRRHSSA